MWVNDILTENMPVLQNTFLDRRYRVSADTKINDKIIEFSLEHWNHALFQDQLDKIFSPTNLLRSFELNDIYATSDEVLNEFLHRLLS